MMVMEDNPELLDGRLELQQRAGNFFRTLFRPLSIYILFGFMLLWLQTLDWFKQNEGLRTLAVHLGIALVGLPLWSGIRRLIAVTEKLEDLFKRESHPTVMLRKALMQNLGGEKLSAHADDVARQCEELVLSVSALLAKKTWASERYVQFVSSLVRGVVGENASELSRLVNDDRTERIFQVPKSAAELADKILEAQMKELNQHDSYYVISDLGSWQSRQLKNFFEETKNAVARGVTVQRIFNLMLPEKLSKDNINILEMHLQASRDWTSEKGGSYKVKVLRIADWPALRANCPEIDEDTIRSPHNAHFGVFQHESEMIRFRVERPDLSTMMLCRHRVRIISESVELFGSLWKYSPNLDESAIKEIEKVLQPRDSEHYVE